MFFNHTPVAQFDRLLATHVIWIRDISGSFHPVSLFLAASNESRWAERWAKLMATIIIRQCNCVS